MAKRPGSVCNRCGQRVDLPKGRAHWRVIHEDEYGVQWIERCGKRIRDESVPMAVSDALVHAVLEL